MSERQDDLFDISGKVAVITGGGGILNTGSMNAIRPLTKVPAYSAAKAAVTNFTQWLAVHFSLNYSKKVRVNAIAPGFFLTHQNRHLLIDEKSGELTPRGGHMHGGNARPLVRIGEFDVKPTAGEGR